MAPDFVWVLGHGAEPDIRKALGLDFAALLPPEAN
jgi:hypothetical protein